MALLHKLLICALNDTMIRIMGISAAMHSLGG